MNGVGEFVEQRVDRRTAVIAVAAAAVGAADRAARVARSVQIVQQRVQLSHVPLRRSVAGQDLGVVRVRHLSKTKDDVNFHEFSVGIGRETDGKKKWVKAANNNNNRSWTDGRRERGQLSKRAFHSAH